MFFEIYTLEVPKECSYSRVREALEAFVQEAKPWKRRPGEVISSDADTYAEETMDRIAKFRVSCTDGEARHFGIKIWDQINSIELAKRFLGILAANGIQWIAIVPFGGADFGTMFGYRESYKGDLSCNKGEMILTVNGLLSFIADIEKAGALEIFQSIRDQIDLFAKDCMDKLTDPDRGCNIAKSLVASIRDPNYFLSHEEVRERLLQERSSSPNQPLAGKS